MSRFRKAPNDVFVSTDIEADGPVPGLNSMLSLGSVVYDEHGELLSTFSINLETLPEAKPDPTTSAWWQERPEAWEQARKEAQPPQSAMTAYREWLRGLEGRPICVAWPASFDFAFVNYYLLRFTGEAPFGHAALDLKSYAMALTARESFSRTSKERLPDEWFTPGLRHSHVALDDALEQGALFMAMYAAARNRPEDRVDLADYSEYPRW